MVWGFREFGVDAERGFGFGRHGTPETFAHGFSRWFAVTLIDVQSIG